MPGPISRTTGVRIDVFTELRRIVNEVLSSALRRSIPTAALELGSGSVVLLSFVRSADS